VYVRDVSVRVVGELVEVIEGQLSTCSVLKMIS
jgi:hypothetical protein